MLVTDRFLSRLAAFALALPLTAAAATPITGTVTNQTNGRPAVGDTVTLIQLAQGMQEANHTTTDSHGHYSLPVADEGIHLIRVTHDKANYFKPAPPGTDVVDLDVYNAAAKVKGVATEAVVMRIQTDAGGQNLSVIENIFVKNDSKPAMTQFSANPFDFYLPDNAAVAGSAALAPGGMPVQATPVPLADKGHYTFLFPIRPGETRFQISYSIPYTGSYPFVVKLSGPTDTVAVMLPKSMTVTPSAGSPLSPVNDDENAQTLVARSLSGSQPISFTLSGSGQLPRDNDAPAQPGQAASGGAADSSQPTPATDNKMPGKGLDNPLDPNGTREPWSRYKYWILAGLAFLLAGAAGLLLRKPPVTTGHPAAAGFATVHPPTPAAAAPVSAASQRDQLMHTIKEQMFLLETDRLQNRISESEYNEQKAALELILRRALSRTESGTV